MNKSIFNQLWELIDACVICSMCGEQGHICPDHYNILTELCEKYETIILHYKEQAIEGNISGVG